MLSPIALVFDILVSLAVGGFIFGFLSFLIERRPMVTARRRLEEAISEIGLARDPHGQVDIAASPLLATLVRWGRSIGKMPGLGQIVDALSRPEATWKIQHNLQLAALHERLIPRDIVAARLAMGLIAGVLLFPLLFAGQPAMILLLVVMFVIGYTLPVVILNRLAATRQQAILSALPRAADVLVVAVEAGLAFGKAIDLYCERFRGPLADELILVQQAVSVGQRQQDTINEMVDRLDIEDLRLLMNSVLQAQRFGVPIAEVLRSLSRDLKLRREQRIRADSLKAPVRMIFPIVLFLMPAVFIIILGPIVLQFAGALGK